MALAIEPLPTTYPLHYLTGSLLPSRCLFSFVAASAINRLSMNKKYTVKPLPETVLAIIRKYEQMNKNAGIQRDN